MKILMMNLMILLGLLFVFPLVAVLPISTIAWTILGLTAFGFYLMNKEEREC